MQAKEMIDKIQDELIQFTSANGFSVEDSEGKKLESVDFSRMKEQVIVLKLEEEG